MGAAADAASATGFGRATGVLAEGLPAARFAAGLRATLRAAGLRAAFFAAFRAVFRAGFLAFGPFLAAFFEVRAGFLRAAFFAAFFFLATSPPPLSRALGRLDHTILSMSNRDEPRVVVRAGPAGLEVEIRPFVRTRRGRIRLAAAAAVLLAAALFGASRLAQAWETGLKKGEFADLPLPVLLLLSAAIGVSTPLALIGLSALSFAEETVEIADGAVTIRRSSFERTRVTRIPLEELDCWRETLLPLPPWWTWAVKRLAARSRGRYEPVAGAVGPREKRALGEILAKATGRPLVDDFGRSLPPSARSDNIPRVR